MEINENHKKPWKNHKKCQKTLKNIIINNIFTNQMQELFNSGGPFRIGDPIETILGNSGIRNFLSNWVSCLKLISSISPTFSF